MIGTMDPIDYHFKTNRYHTSGNAKALWDHLKELFHDIKYARALNLDNELRSIRIGKMTVNEYCTKIKSMSGTMRLLKNSSFNDDSGASTDFESSSSSPTVLMASNSSNNKGPTGGSVSLYGPTGYSTRVFHFSYATATARASRSRPNTLRIPGHFNS
ncbi:hypothetical protein Tco_0881084 [Tanacetum coccineum]